MKIARFPLLLTTLLCSSLDFTKRYSVHPAASEEMSIGLRSGEENLSLTNGRPGEFRMRPASEGEVHIFLDESPLCLDDDTVGVCKKGEKQSEFRIKAKGEGHRIKMEPSNPFIKMFRTDCLTVRGSKLKAKNCTDNGKDQIFIFKDYVKKSEGNENYWNLQVYEPCRGKAGADAGGKAWLPCGNAAVNEQRQGCWTGRYNFVAAPYLQPLTSSPQINREIHGLHHDLNRIPGAVSWQLRAWPVLPHAIPCLRC